MQATAKDLRFHSTELLNTVKRGEEVIITYHGKACAKLVPMDNMSNIDKKNSEIGSKALFGIWKNDTDTADVDAYIRSLRKGRFDAG